jgi:hypothetical protein
MATTARTEVKVYRDYASADVIRVHNTHHSLIPQKSCKLCRRWGTAWIVVA